MPLFEAAQVVHGSLGVWIAAGLVGDVDHDHRDYQLLRLDVWRKPPTGDEVPRCVEVGGEVLEERPFLCVEAVVLDGGGGPPGRPKGVGVGWESTR